MNEQIIIDFRELLEFNQVLRLPDDCFRQLLELAVRTYPHKTFEADIWHILEAHIEIDQMSTTHLENLEISIHQFIESCDNHIRYYLAPYEDKYDCEVFIDPWTAIFVHMELET